MSPIIDLPLEPVHKHHFTIPVEWAYFNGMEAGELILQHRKVTKLRCDGCPEEIER